ncbi:MAG: TIGR03808 family TAT-translocated repetitive protein [Alphaproteobacteria bacterium]|nr:TIGR03808 family TAT-translocated repetitive protein [Alphaproteobacteria bacterium]
MNRRKFLAFSGTAAMGAAASLTPSIAQAAPPTNSLNAADLGLKPNISANQSAIFQQVVDGAAAKQLPLFIPAGSYVVGDILLPSNIHIYGVKGQSILAQRSDMPILFNIDSDNIMLENINFNGNQAGLKLGAMVRINGAKNLTITQCQFFNSNGNGLHLYGCGGQIISNHFHDIDQAALFCENSHKLTIVRNEIYDIGNNGILIWQEKKADDGSIISHNHIYKINDNDGGNGQNGNGINVFKANNVIISDNQFEQCAYSAVRVNDGNNCQIVNNQCHNIGEVALYAEFGFNGVMINNNLVDTAGAGISVANLDQDGHLALIKGNLLRNLTLRAKATENDDSRAYGIAAEADALIEGNVVENATNFGIGGGYGEFLRNVSVVNNMLKDCGYGITASVAQGAGRMTISHNSINNAHQGAIVGFEWDQITTSDLVDQDQTFDQGSHNNLYIRNNVVI